MKILALFLTLPLIAQSLDHSICNQKIENSIVKNLKELCEKYYREITKTTKTTKTTATTTTTETPKTTTKFKAADDVTTTTAPLTQSTLNLSAMVDKENRKLRKRLNILRKLRLL